MLTNVGKAHGILVTMISTGTQSIPFVSDQLYSTAGLPIFASLVRQAPGAQCLCTCMAAVRTTAGMAACARAWQPYRTTGNPRALFQ